ncbi:hypothetical protein [Streptomyces sp. G1]|uniref:hypothetical protein n=1 Tax=Streptomyces sp. G1 TaxID=361572 RepID=UPI0027E4A421|nr:hypothetical protein [Streptomyces sp. G1]
MANARAGRHLPLAANHDATRLMTLVESKTPHQAARRLRHRVGALLPIDVITTHYPDADHTVLLNVAFSPAAHDALTADACRTAPWPNTPTRKLTVSTRPYASY